MKSAYGKASVHDANNLLRAHATAGITRADFYSGPYRISADVFTGKRRLLDALRDAMPLHVDLRHLEVSSLLAVGQSTEYADGLLSKAQIDWVAVRHEPLRTEGGVYGFVKKAPVRVSLVLGTHRIDGTVYVDNGATDRVLFYLRALALNSESFLVVTAAHIESASGAVEQDVRLAIVNRTAIRAFSASALDDVVDAPGDKPHR